MAKKKETPRAPGVTTIAPNVLVRIAQLAALSIDGVAGLSNTPGGVNRLFKRGASEGAQVEIEDGQVAVDLYLVMENGVDVRETGHKVQAEVSRAMDEMVGMPATRVDVHIDQIELDAAD